MGGLLRIRVQMLLGSCLHVCCLLCCRLTRPERARNRPLLACLLLLPAAPLARRRCPGEARGRRRGFCRLPLLRFVAVLLAACRAAAAERQAVFQASARIDCSVARVSPLIKVKGGAVAPAPWSLHLGLIGRSDVERSPAAPQ